MKRYFICDYFKRRVVIDYLKGKPECVVCKNNLILEIHHLRGSKIAVFLCPTHHRIIHEEIYNDYSKNKIYSLKQLINRIKYIEKRNKQPKYIKRYKEVYGYELAYIKKVRCFICGYTSLLYMVEFRKDKIVYLCPNHDMMMHKHLKKGKRFVLKEIYKGVKEIEKEAKPYYKEITKKQFLKDYKGYRLIRLISPKNCKKCGDWVYPTKENKNICPYCLYEEKMLVAKKIKLGKYKTLQEYIKVFIKAYGKRYINYLGYFRGLMVENDYAFLENIGDEIKKEMRKAKKNEGI